MAKKSRKKNAMADLELLAKTQTIDERVKGWLGPWEAETLWAQKILIWEYPYFSCGLFVLVNVIFWFVYLLRIIHNILYFYYIYILFYLLFICIQCSTQISIQMVANKQNIYWNFGDGI